MSPSSTLAVLLLCSAYYSLTAGGSITTCRPAAIGARSVILCPTDFPEDVTTFQLEWFYYSNESAIPMAMCNVSLCMTLYPFGYFAEMVSTLGTLTGRLNIVKVRRENERTYECRFWRKDRDEISYKRCDLEVYSPLHLDKSNKDTPTFQVRRGGHLNHQIHVIGYPAPKSCSLFQRNDGGRSKVDSWKYHCTMHERIAKGLNEINTTVKMTMLGVREFKKYELHIHRIRGNGIVYKFEIERNTTAMEQATRADTTKFLIAIGATTFVIGMFFACKCACRYMQKRTRIANQSLELRIVGESPSTEDGNLKPAEEAGTTEADVHAEESDVKLVLLQRDDSAATTPSTPGGSDFPQILDSGLGGNATDIPTSEHSQESLNKGSPDPSDPGPSTRSSITSDSSIATTRRRLLGPPPEPPLPLLSQPQKAKLDVHGYSSSGGHQPAGKGGSAPITGAHEKESHWSLDSVVSEPENFKYHESKYPKTPSERSISETLNSSEESSSASDQDTLSTGSQDHTEEAAIPLLSEKPEKSDVSEELGKSGVSENPEKSDVSEEPEKSDVSEEPEKSGVSEEPEKSGVSEEPEKSGVSEEPEKSGVSEEPEKSGVSEEPEKSGVSEEPKKSEASEKAEKSAVPEEPEKSGASEKAEKSGISENAE